MWTMQVLRTHLVGQQLRRVTLCQCSVHCDCSLYRQLFAHTCTVLNVTVCNTFCCGGNKQV